MKNLNQRNKTRRHCQHERNATSCRFLFWCNLKMHRRSNETSFSAGSRTLGALWEAAKRGLNKMVYVGCWIKSENSLDVGPVTYLPVTNIYISQALFGRLRSAVPPPFRAAASQQQGSSRRQANRMPPIMIRFAILTRSTVAR